MIAWSPDTQNPAGDRVDAFVATGTAALIAGLVGAATTTATGVYGAHKQSSNADLAAQLSAKANDEQLAFMRSQAARDQANFEAAQGENRRQFDSTQRANYDVWSSEAGRDENRWGYQQGNLAPYRSIGAGATRTLANMIGIPMDEGAFTPPTWTPPPYQGDATAPGAAATSRALPQINWTAPSDALSSQIAGYFKAQGVPDAETPYWVQQAKSLYDRGVQLKDPRYGDKRLAAAEIFRGAATAPAAPAAAPAAAPTTLRTVVVPNATGGRDVTQIRVPTAPTLNNFVTAAPSYAMAGA